jgi:hypothetical protein
MRLPLFIPKHELNIHDRIFLSAFSWAISVSITILFQKNILKEHTSIILLTMVAFVTTSIALYITYFIFGIIV